jgi:hypothetical protein
MKTGFSTLAGQNETADNDTVTFWLIDADTTEHWGEVLHPGETSEVRSLTPGHTYFYAAVSWKAVAAYNASFRTIHDPTARSLAYSATLQRLSGEVEGSLVGSPHMIRVV